MNVNKYSDSELHLMSYKDLRRLSIILQLPANIKKKYMISMIQAHQKGDVCTKTAIANKIMEERKVKRMGSEGKQTKSFMLGPTTTTQQIPTDLSVATKHEFETRFSYVAHYTSEDKIKSGISRIIKQKAEVSRRNRNILQQSRKSTRKLSAGGRTEIMLPRNHSLTTPVRLMPQFERSFVPSTQYDPTTGITSPRNHFQEANFYNYHFHGEYSNAVIPSSSHELTRNEAYWPTREVYSNPLMPMLSSLLSPNPSAINSSAYGSQYASQNVIKAPSSFQQGVYEKYLKSETIVENQSFQSSAANSSTVIVNNHFPNDANNNNNNTSYNINHDCRSYVVTKNDVDFEMNLSLNEVDSETYGRRDGRVIRNMVDFYLPRTGEPGLNLEIPQHAKPVQDLSQYKEECLRTNAKDLSPAPVLHRPFETSPVPVLHRSFETSPVTPPPEAGEISEGETSHREPLAPVAALGYYESVYIQEEKFWEESEAGYKKLETRNKLEKNNFVDRFLTTQAQGSFLSEASESSTDFSVEMELGDPLVKSRENIFVPNFPRCRYVLGHNKYPEAVKSMESDRKLPSFLSTFCTNGLFNKGYSVCKGSITGTTETHLNPIMTSKHATQFTAAAAAHPSPQDTHNSINGSLIERQWLYPVSQTPLPGETNSYSNWDEYSDDAGTTHNKDQDVQVVKCRKHGCHYLYSIANPCD